VVGVLVHQMVVAERLHMAELLSGLSPEQLRTQSLCDAWSVREVAAHLATYLRFGQLKIYAGVVLGLGDLGPANEWLARHYARESDQRIIDRLARGTHSRVTVPRSGYDPVLADAVLHDLDVRIPLGLERRIPEEHLLVSFHHLANEASPGYAMGSRLEGLRIEATDTGWSAGSGAPVRGGIEDVLLSISGRRVALDRLEGDGAAILRERVLAGGPVPVGRRMGTVLGLLVSPSARRSKRSQAPPIG
jgi:uncharacterized protein (TIGR03083 family)